MTTMRPALPYPCLLATLVLMVLFSGPTLAQQEPLTGTMMSHRDLKTPPQRALASVIPDGTTATAPHGPTIATPAPRDEDFTAAEPGDATRHLLQMQVSASRSGPHLPMLGDEATASYRRYLKSFEHPIPEFYKTTVGKNGDSGR
ncbi:DUF3613 domain-containing protein [Dyella sp.]|uniref:DUF3613 domain-containing protein n=1 Tax=Dyella sp. TaxID=1869338 RepID=UPI003F801DEB